MTIDTGDYVRHEPSGEQWVVAFVDGDHLAWVGWPEGRADLADCTLIERATPETRDAVLQMMSTSEGRRGSYARERLAASLSTTSDDSKGRTE